MAPKKLYTLLVAFLISQVITAQTILLTGHLEQEPTQGVMYLDDSMGKYTIDQLNKPDGYKLFKPVKVNSFKNSTKIYWLKFTLVQDSLKEDDWILDFQNWSLVTLYSNQLVKKTGHLYPYLKRDYPVANKSYIFLHFDKKESKTCIVRLESQFNNEIVPEDLDFRIMNKAEIDEKNIFIRVMISAFTGIFIVMLMYNFFIFISTKLRSYGYYLLVLFFAIYHTQYNSGYLISTFKNIPDFPLRLRYFEMISSTLLGIAILLFVREILKVPERYPRWNRLISFTLWIAVITIILPYINKEMGTLIGAFFGLILLILVICLAIKSVISKYPSAIYFLIGYSSFLLSMLVLFLAYAEVLPKTVYTWEFSLPFGTCLEIVFFSFGLANLINSLKRENEQKQMRIISQLEENEVLQTKVNRELEQKVAERTAEINAQKDEISEQKQAIEIEKKKSDELLLNILPEFTATELKEKGFAVPRNYENASILFTDFVSFTGISEKLSPAELVYELDFCFRQFDEIVYKHNLEKIKTIGDSYMAVAGVPVEDSESAMHAVAAAIEIRDCVIKWNTEKVREGKVPCGIRIGIHTGPVTAGVVGKKKFAFDIWGDTVNVASRMESSGESNKVNISGTTYELIKDNFVCFSRGLVKAKHKGELEMYFVLNPK